MEINTLISGKMLQERIIELANQIENDYENKEITIVSVLRGAVFFTVDLTKNIKNKINFEFIEVSSYGNCLESTGNIKINKDLSESVEEKDILIVEDIIDSGRTMANLKEIFKVRQCKDFKICTLLDKKERRKAQIDIDYTGFIIPNKFVVGYGLDYDQKYRNLPYIGIVEFE